MAKSMSEGVSQLRVCYDHYVFILRKCGEYEKACMQVHAAFWGKLNIFINVNE
jgi:hypothetical protein